MLLMQENEELKRTVAQLQAALQQQQQQVSLNHPLTTDMAVQVDLVSLYIYYLPIYVCMTHLCMLH